MAVHPSSDVSSQEWFSKQHVIIPKTSNASDLEIFLEIFLGIFFGTFLTPIFAVHKIPAAVYSCIGAGKLYLKVYDY